METLDIDSHFNDFKRPQFAPVYFPSEKEFSNPIDYVNHIAPEAEKYGVVKIVPPKSFSPPFKFPDKNKLSFYPRLQQLNRMDLCQKERLLFYHNLIHFWELQGWDFQVPTINDVAVNLLKIKEDVAQCGGFQFVRENDLFLQIASDMGYNSKKIAQRLLDIYSEYVDPYVRHIEQRDPNAPWDDDDDSTSEGKKKEKNEEVAADNGMNDTVFDMSEDFGKQSTSAIYDEEEEDIDEPQYKRRRARPKRKAVQKAEKIKAKSVCCKCKKGNKEALLMMCEECSRAQHTFCCDPIFDCMPPKGYWRCLKCVYARLNVHAPINFSFPECEQKFDLRTFIGYGNKFKAEFFDEEDHDLVDIDVIERAYWRNFIDPEGAEVMYGSDLQASEVGSGFPRRDDKVRKLERAERTKYLNHPWNLNNTAILDQSVLKHLGTEIPGMTVPWVYIGMCFSTFCWHVEDHWTYSINYHHWGSPKVWYGIPGHEAEAFETVVQYFAPNMCDRYGNIFHDMTNVFNPALLEYSGVEIFSVHQHPGEFVVTFPRAYHCGFNTGVNFAEATNFATAEWLEMGRRCVEHYALTQRRCVFSHDELVLKMMRRADVLDLNTNYYLMKEIKEMLRREVTGRYNVADANVLVDRFENFEDMDDDARTCCNCQTTMYLSGVTCCHTGRISCLKCIEYLCDDCPYIKCELRLLFTIVTLSSLTKKVVLACQEVQKWHQGFVELSAKNKLMYSTILRTLDHIRLRKYPLTGAVHLVERLEERGRYILGNTKEVRLALQLMRRENDLTYYVTENAIHQALLWFLDSPLNMTDLTKQIEEIMNRFIAWRNETREHILAGIDSRRDDTARFASIFLKGQQFGIDCPELKQLHEMIQVLQTLFPRSVSYKKKSLTR